MQAKDSEGLLFQNQSSVFKVRRPWRKVNCSITVSGGCHVHVYLHTHCVATRNSISSLISVATFGSAALVKIDAFVKTLTVSTLDKHENQKG